MIKTVSCSRMIRRKDNFTLQNIYRNLENKDISLRNQFESKKASKLQKIFLE